uniref:NADH-ubiquinone oxidoreductase chain 4 n=1 Tax=Pallaseopsis kessleri TaxID=686709 RepID=A0A1L5BW69_9CRUS|nr:NADH dehydrogenase subunit 4 [Pallaseopsis kessleri]APL97203.1 NADH dehydrogenase subunit 4 [Pallaseopsis kessleri]
MLSLVMSVFSMAGLFSFWGEILLLTSLMSGLALMSSSDTMIWKSGLMGELDSMSWVLCLLSFWIVFLAVLGSKPSTMRGLFLVSCVLVLGFFLLSFYVSDFIFFYVGFEACLVPFFFLILGWGYQPERSQAGIYMVFYTLFGSLPLFAMLLIFCSCSSGYMHLTSGCFVMDSYFFIFLTGAFLVKFPIYSMHLWLLKAHVEAPLAGSMILAGVMLKLGGYGLIRVLAICQGSPLVLSEFIISLSLWGGVILSISCLRQSDMKLLIAGSSVVHMSLCVAGLLSLSEWGVKGCVVIMFGHGLCSSGLFYLANLVYLRSHSRSLMVSKGLLNLMPSMGLWWFMMMAANMAAPPSLNLLGEIMLISALMSVSVYLSVALGLVSFFSGAYSLYLFSLSQQGSYLGTGTGFHSGSMIEHLVSAAHWVPLNGLILFLSCLI